MRATTYGAIHKKRVLIEKDTPGIFLEEQKKRFLSLRDKKNTLYNKETLIRDTALNYLNLLPENAVEESLKNILLKEYYECEKLYPYLGDYFLHLMFNKKRITTSTGFLFDKRKQDKFLKTLQSKTVVEIVIFII